MRREAIARGGDELLAVSRRYRTDPEYRRLIDEKPERVLDALGFVGDNVVAAGCEVNVHVAERDEFHLCLPAPPNRELRDLEMTRVAGGARSTDNCIGSFGTASSIPSCVASISTAGSFGGD